MIRGLKEAFNYMDNLGAHKIFTDKLGTVMAKNKLLTGNDEYLSEAYELETQKNLILTCAFNLKIHNKRYSLSVPVLSVNEYIKEEDSYSFGYYKDVDILNITKRRLEIASSNVRDTYGRLNISFCNSVAEEISFLVGVVDNEIVFMFRVSDLASYIKSFIDNDTLVIVIKESIDFGEKEWTLRLSLEDYSIQKWGY